MEIWPRPRYTKPGSKRRIVYEGFSARNMKEFRVNARHGLPEGPAPEGLRVVLHQRPEHSNGLDVFFQSRFLDTLRARFGAKTEDESRIETRTAALKKLPYGWGLVCESDDGPDNGPLQFALAFIRAMFDFEAQAVVDVDTGLWILPEDIAKYPPGADFSILPFVNVVIDKRPSPNGPFVVHTRGLVKFGRPDLAICCVPQLYLTHAQTFLYTISNYLAQGAHLEPDESLTLKNSPKVFARAYSADDPLGLGLGNACLYLMDDGTKGPPGDVTRWLSWWAEQGSTV